MNRPMTGLLLILPALLIVSSARGQFTNEVPDRPEWGLEVTVLANYTHFAFEQINEHITVDSRELKESSGYASLENIDEFEDQVTYDFRLGARWRNWRFGGGYAHLPEQTGSFFMEGSGFQPDFTYDIKVSAREFHVYAGYLYPVRRWLDVGLLTSIGGGWAKGELTDTFWGAEDVMLEGTYAPWRLELRSQIHLTRYIALDLGAGYRVANLTDMTADYGVAGVNGIDGSSGPLYDFDGMPIDFDFSGWYAGGGLTLKNPFEGTNTGYMGY